MRRIEELERRLLSDEVAELDMDTWASQLQEYMELKQKDERTVDAKKWDIVVSGPFAPAFLIDTGEHGEAIMSSNGRAYPTSELERVAPFFSGQPVFWRHVYGGPIRQRSRLVLGSKGRVGHLANAWWHEEKREIRAELVVVSEHWLEVFSQDEERHKYGFSMDVNATGKVVRGLDVTWSITRVFSVDMEERRWCAMGGRFLDAPTLTEEQIQEKVWAFEDSVRARFDRIGGLKS